MLSKGTCPKSEIDRSMQFIGFELMLVHICDPLVNTEVKQCSHRGTVKTVQSKTRDFRQSGSAYFGVRAMKTYEAL